VWHTQTKLMSSIIVPAILSDNISDYVRFTKSFALFSTKLHIDVMDGVLVISRSPKTSEIMEAIKHLPAQLAVHLMVSEPEPDLELLKKYSNVYLVYIHAEVFKEEFLDRDYPFQLGLVVDPSTELAEYKHLYQRVPVVQVMAIYPGRQGSYFIPNALDRIKEVRNLDFNGEIHIDGHVNEVTIPDMLAYDPAVLNTGSALTKATNPEEKYLELQSICELH
jgi:pentose-5-phosphate-3-epimerase